MVVAIGLWSLELTPQKVQTLVPPADVRITNVSFGESENSGRSVVKIGYRPALDVDSDSDVENERMGSSPPSSTIILCSLKPGSFEQASTNIVIQGDEEYTFRVTGKNAVYLSGNYLEQNENSLPIEGSEFNSEEEDDYALQGIGSSDEMHPEFPMGKAGPSGKVEEAPGTSKRPHDSEDGLLAARPSKVQKNKKKNGTHDEKSMSIKLAGIDKEPEKIETEKTRSKEDKREVDPAQSKKGKSITREIIGGITVFDAKIGTGPAAKKGSTVSLRYIGKLPNGKVFDKNTEGKPFTFNLGKGEVIKGWEEGVVGMQVGGERKLTIPPEMAYRDKAMGDIPKNSTLIFDLKLLKLK